LQDGTFHESDQPTPLKTDVRIVAVPPKNLAVEFLPAFREICFYRLNVVELSCCCA
jgi:DNA-binding NtrC family response regulator